MLNKDFIHKHKQKRDDHKEQRLANPSISTIDILKIIENSEKDSKIDFYNN